MTDRRCSRCRRSRGEWVAAEQANSVVCVDCLTPDEREQLERRAARRRVEDRLERLDSLFDRLDAER